MSLKSPRECLITREDATSILLREIFPRLGQSPKGKGLLYSLLEEDDKFFSFSATVEDLHNHSHMPKDRYRVDIDRVSGEIGTPVLICLSQRRLEDAILQGTGQHLSRYSRFNDGSLSISYKVSVVEDGDIQYVVQLRHHGDIASMNALMQLVSTNIKSHILPIPSVYPIADEQEQQQKRGMGIQITKFVPGAMASKVYPSMSHQNKLLLVRKVALAFDALWRIPLPGRLIGELKATRENDSVALYVGPDRHFSLGGPFSSVADYLRAMIHVHLRLFEKQECVDEYKAVYLQRVRDFVAFEMSNIPDVVENIPIVPVHSDMGLHNIIVSETNHTDIMAVIDWEFCASAPYATNAPVIEPLFRRWSPNGQGEEYPHADELRTAFWGEIPDWRKWNESEAGKTFLEWFEFAKFMRPEPVPDIFDEAKKKVWWAKNVATTESFLRKYSRFSLN
jgi:Phosphotransferase enzyme family